MNQLSSSKMKTIFTFEQLFLSTYSTNKMVNFQKSHKNNLEKKITWNVLTLCYRMGIVRDLNGWATWCSLHRWQYKQAYMFTQRTGTFVQFSIRPTVFFLNSCFFAIRCFCYSKCSLFFFGCVFSWDVELPCLRRTAHLTFNTYIHYSPF